jgi:outer membrane receptor protein involved in Fe transport
VQWRFFRLQSQAKWRGNMSITWARGGFSLTPNLSWVGSGTVNNAALTQASNPTLYGWALTGFPDAILAGTPGAPADAQAQSRAAAQGGYLLMPNSFTNHMPSYFLFGLNGAYSFNKVPGIKVLQLYAQVNNLFNRALPTAMSAAPSSAPRSATPPTRSSMTSWAWRTAPASACRSKSAQRNRHAITVPSDRDPRP